jgi:low affinity Fe/Cu permease
MPLTDDQVIEAIKKANSEDIEKRVYDKIRGDLLKLKFAGGIGAVIVLLFGLFHQTVFKIVVEQGGGGLKTEIRNSVDGDLKRLDEIRMKVTAISEMTHRELDGILVSVANHHNEIVGIENRWKSKVDETNSLLDTLTQKATEFAEKAKVFDERIKTAQSTTEALERRYKPIIETIETLAKNQDEIFKNQKEAASQSKTPIATVSKVSVPTIEVSTKGIIYFQFSGYSRDEVNDIRKGLSDAKWTVPGAESVQKSTATEVRYNPADEVKAAALLADVKNVLRKLGLSPDISLSREPLVKPGILELWIAKVTS